MALENYALTNTHHARRSLRARTEHLSKSWYMVLGGTEPWVDDTKPPLPAEDVTSVNTPIVAVKAELTWVKRNVNGSIELLVPGGLRKYDPILTEESLLTEQSRLCIISGEILNGYIPDGTKFREIGIVSNLVANPGVENTDILTSSQILDYGALEFIHYRQPNAPYGWDNKRVYHLDILVAF